MPPSTLPTTVQLRQMDPKIWRACAGNSVQIPTAGSYVYYFPQGHVEQSLYRPFLSPEVFSKPVIPCRITSVQLLADSLTDEVFAKLLLHPIRDRNFDVSLRLASNEFGQVDNVRDEDRVVPFAKILTSSDANNGGGFSVPRYCAESIFPRLNYEADPPVQNLMVTDVHGVVWTFRHIYRGTPRRHLLTTGWSKFVNHKKLVAGDSVVFSKNSNGELFVGIRRDSRSNGSSDCATWSTQNSGVRYNVEENRSGEGGREVFSRSGIGKLSADAVSKAVELAVQNMPFEVVYYPRAGWMEFVVKAETVDESLNVYWTPGIRVKKAMETEDSSRLTWYQGTVSSVSTSDQGPWRNSPWRMLQVTWDETEAPQNARYVNPWEVEFASPTTSVQTPLHPAKRFRGLQKFEMMASEEVLFPITRFNDTAMEEFNRSLLTFNSFPAGMQGARQNLLYGSMLPNPYNETTPLSSSNNTLCKLDAAGLGKLPSVSAELRIGSSQSNDLSPDSQGSGSVLSFATDATRKQSGLKSILLFGTVINVNPADSGHGDTNDDNNTNQSG